MMQGKGTCTWVYCLETRTARGWMQCAKDPRSRGHQAQAKHATEPGLGPEWLGLRRHRVPVRRQYTRDSVQDIKRCRLCSNNPALAAAQCASHTPASTDRGQ